MHMYICMHECSLSEPLYHKSNYFPLMIFEEVLKYYISSYFLSSVSLFNYFFFSALFFFLFPSRIVLNSFSGSSCLFSANKPLAQCKGLRIQYCKNPSVLGIIQMALEMLESLSGHTISACESLGLHLKFSGNHVIIETMW